MGGWVGGWVGECVYSCICEYVSKYTRRDRIFVVQHSHQQRFTIGKGKRTNQLCMSVDYCFMKDDIRIAENAVHISMLGILICALIATFVGILFVLYQLIFIMCFVYVFDCS